MVLETSSYLFLLYLYYVSSYKLVPHNKRFNATANICHHKSHFYAQILIYFKPSFLLAHLRSDCMVT